MKNEFLSKTTNLCVLLIKCDLNINLRDKYLIFPGRIRLVEIKGKIIEILPEKSGQSANGEWRKQEYVLETESNYPKKICFMAWGNKIDEFNLKQGETVEVSVDLESREYNGRWYTDVKAWKVSKDGMDAPNAHTNGNQDLNQTENGTNLSIGDDDIPF